MSSTREELETAYKKAVKTLDGEKRAAIKKAKGTKGKKAKEAVATVEEDYASRLKEMQQEYELKIQSLERMMDDGPHTQSDQDVAPQLDDAIETPELLEKEKKLLKARKKKERQKEREMERQAAEARENAEAGPSLRDVELEQIQAVLAPLDLCVNEVEADGHCLYRAIGAQTSTSYQEIRKCFLE